ncbi:MAG: hypothetical protein KKD31_05790 [Bacteroidetes bacterium]|nr:hypothetical protein [Bacteroidota bacterium]
MIGFTKVTCNTNPRIEQFSSNDEAALKTANRYFTDGQYADALPILDSLVSKYPDHANINYLLGVCILHTTGILENSKSYFEVAAKNVSSFTKTGIQYTQAPVEALLYLAQVYHAEYNFELAIVYYEKYKTYLTLEETGLKEDVDRQIKICQVARLDSLALNLGSELSLKSRLRGSKNQLDLNQINTSYSESGLSFMNDGSIVFSSSKPAEVVDPNMPRGLYTSDVYIMRRSGNAWLKPELIDEFSSIADEQFSCFSYDGKTAIVASDMSGNFNLYISFRNDDGTWPKPHKMKLNTHSDETSAFITNDGNQLYFVSDRRGGIGGKDIYYCNKDEKGKWGKPINAGATINTKYDEESPWLSPDGADLYFSSNGHKTLGKYDIFYSRKQGSEWSKPLNVGNVITLRRKSYISKKTPTVILLFLIAIVLVEKELWTCTLWIQKTLI